MTIWKVEDCVLNDRLRYELQLMGKWVIVTPIVLVIFMSMSPFVLRMTNVKTMTLLIASLEMFLPLLAGIIVATICMHDSAIELQLTLPTLYRRTIWRRIGLVTFWTAIISCLLSIVVYSLNPLRQPQEVQSWSVGARIILGQLTWLAPLVWMIALSLVLSLVFRSRVASVSVLGALWVGENIVYGLFLSTNWLRPIFIFATTLTPLTLLTLNFWLSNRLWLLGIALLLLIIAWWRLYSVERLLPASGSGEE
ncbi:hypothetical protein [Tengunoibacter tsumagoiensis]|uniref:Uncharacterized protein n=1 Tax=Tengunoibacter tsumagoiensis TaxID=2014871 RepID=A0A401ZY85_9CHLR|nr:hypothetical protein [Tengunoibacter tsumagoiensis]GCE11805.1 hypothetical protein KTT_16640 [Tengunoibacter tsumagoiensis]